MDLLDALRARCLLAVLQPDDEARIRQIFRWYSHQYATPLHLVGDLPLEDVLTAYFEDMYAQMEDPEVQSELAELIETPTERAARLKEEAQSVSNDDAFVKALDEEARKERERLKNPVKNRDKVSGLTTGIARQPVIPTPQAPEISMNFDNNLLLEDNPLLESLMNIDPIGAPPPGKKKKT